MTHSAQAPTRSNSSKRVGNRKWLWPASGCTKRSTLLERGNAAGIAAGSPVMSRLPTPTSTGTVICAASGPTLSGSIDLNARTGRRLQRRDAARIGVGAAVDLLAIAGRADPRVRLDEHFPRERDELRALLG